jgi:hypothetical protein
MFERYTETARRVIFYSRSPAIPLTSCVVDPNKSCSNLSITPDSGSSRVTFSHYRNIVRGEMACSLSPGSLPGLFAFSVLTPYGQCRNSTQPPRTQDAAEVLVTEMVTKLVKERRFDNSQDNANFCIIQNEAKG